MSYRVILTLPAEDQASMISDWWELFRPKAPGLFDEELAWGLEFLGHAPLIGAHVSGRRPSIRRLLLRKSRYFLYYRVIDERRLVEVLAIWHSAKGDEPEL